MARDNDNSWRLGVVNGTPGEKNKFAEQEKNVKEPNAQTQKKAPVGITQEKNINTNKKNELVFWLGIVIALAFSFLTGFILLPKEN